MIRWADLTEKQKESIGNGCGPSFIPEKITKPLFGWFHTASCDRHDFGYKRGGDEAIRKAVDLGFYNSMRVDAGSNKLSRVQAVIYYKAVRWFGWLFFHYGSSRNLADILK